MSSQHGHNQNQMSQNVDTTVGVLSDAQLLIRNTIRGLSYLNDNIEYLVLNEYYEEEIARILNLGWVLENKHALIAERMENSSNGELASS